jgi:hypothetical protein
VRSGKYFGSELKETKLQDNGDKYVLCTFSLIFFKAVKFGRVRWMGSLVRLIKVDIRRAI